MVSIHSIGTLAKMPGFSTGNLLLQSFQSLLLCSIKSAPGIHHCNIFLLYQVSETQILLFSPYHDSENILISYYQLSVHEMPEYKPLSWYPGNIFFQLIPCHYIVPVSFLGSDLLNFQITPEFTLGI